MLAMALVSAAIINAQAQQLPDAGSLLRENERQQPQLPKPAPQAVPQTPMAKPQGDLRVLVKTFKLTGNALIGEPELQTVLAPWVGKEVGYTELQQATDAIANEYRRRGWFARPQLPAQDISDGIIEINILEGKLGEVKIDDQGKDLRISKDFVSDSMTARQQPGTPLNLDALDRSNNLLNDTPGVAVATVLAVGKNPGETDAIVKVQDKPLLAGIVQLDNQGARSTGENKLTVNGNFDNPFGIGDQIAISSNFSQGSDYLRLAYSVPVGRDGLRMGISTSAMQYKLIGDFKPLNAKGDAQTYGINGYYPILRSGTRNFGVAFAVDRKNYYNEANAVATSDKAINAAIISFNGDSLDGLGNGGMTLASLNITGGHVDLSAVPANEQADQNGPRTAGGYGKIGYSLSRLQRITDKATLWATVYGQRAGKNLDSSEKMSLGGPNGVRAYPVIEGTGDDGWLTTLEGRYNFMPELQVQAFYDHGHIQQSHNPDYVGAPKTNSATFKGAGLGVSWTQAGNFILRAVWARRIGDNPLPNPINGKDGDGSYDLNRFWLTAIKFF
jgi:hemolysin activation/secretion protein